MQKTQQNDTKKCKISSEKEYLHALVLTQNKSINPSTIAIHIAKRSCPSTVPNSSLRNAILGACMMRAINIFHLQTDEVILTVPQVAPGEV